MTQRPYRAAVIGCGRIGGDCGDPASGSSRLTSHAAAYRSVERTELVALSDSDQGRLARAGQRHGVTRLYPDYRALLDRERPDVVSICTPSDSHASVVRDVLHQGAASAILLEKPIASSVEAAGAVVQDVSGSRVVVAVNYTRRFMPVYQRLVADVHAGGLGRMQHIAALYGKGVFNNGTHMLDLLRWLFGDPSDVTATAVASGGADPTLDLRIAWRDGCSAWMRGTDSGAYNVFELDLVGTAGRVRLTDVGHRLERYHVEDTRFGFRQLSAVPVVEPTGLHGAIRAAVENLIDCIESDAAPACGVSDGFAALALATAAAGQVADAVSVRNY
jgi:predicted dehydrogenase